MNRYAFSIFGINIAWYGIFISSAMVLGVFILTKIGKKRGYKESDLIDLVLWVLPLSIIGARLYYVAFEWEHYADDLMKIFATREGGLAIHGGIIAGLITGLIFSKIRKLNFADLADMFSIPLILGQAIGRWGNFTNAEAHGGPTDLPWAILVDGVRVHPTFLYESIWNIGIFVFLIISFKNRKYYGEHFLKYISLYSFGRFFIEALRTDSLMFMGMRVAQLISVLIIVFSVILYFMIVRKNPVNSIDSDIGRNQDGSGT